MDGTFGEHTRLSVLNIFATDIAQVILNARLFEQAELSVDLEERNKLARDLHDSVTRALYGINLYADAIQRARQHNKQDIPTKGRARGGI